MNIFYVYKYIRSKNSKHGSIGSPYYIGKGKGYRAWDKTHRVKPPTCLTNIVIISNNLLEVDAFQLEKDLIKQYGRIDLGTGCLRNMTDGGEGNSGRKASEESRAKLSAVMKGKNGYKHSEEAKANMKEAQRLRRLR